MCTRLFAAVIFAIVAPLVHAATPPAADVAPIVAQFVGALAGGEIKAFNSFAVEPPGNGEVWNSVRETVEANECITIRSWQIEDVSGDEQAATVRVVLDISAMSRGLHRDRAIARDWTLALVHDAQKGWRLRGATTTVRAIAHRIIEGDPAAEELMASAWERDPITMVKALADVANDALGEKVDDPHAMAVLRRSMAMAEATGDLPTQSLCWTMSALSEHFAGRHDSAYSQAVRALSLANRSKNVEAINRALFMLSLMEWYDAKPHEAIADMRRSADLIGESDDPRGSLKALVMLEMFLQGRGDLRGSLVTTQRLREASRRYGWIEGEANGELLAGSLYYDLREYDVAEEHFQRGESLFRSIQKPEYVSMAVFNRATLARARGDLKRAAKLLSLAIGNSTDGQVRGEMLLGLASTQRLDGNLEAAEASITTAIGLISQNEGTLLGDCLTELSHIRRAQHRPEEAIEAARRALVVRQRAGVMNVTDDSAAATELALAVRDAGRKREAIKLLGDAIGAIEKRRVEVSLDATTASRFFDDNTEPYIALADLLADAHRDREAFTVAERMRARALSDALRQGRSGDSGSMSEDEKGTEDALNRQIETLNRALVAEGGTAGRKRLQDELDETRRLLDQHRTDMLLTHPELRLRPLEASRKTTAIEGTAIVEYLVGEQRTLAFVITRSAGKTQTRAYALPFSRKEVARLTTRLDDMIAAHDLDYGRTARRLYSMLLAPLEKSFEGQKSLCIVPHDVLWRVPFQLLIDPNGSSVIDRFAIFYTPSVAMLATATARHTPKPKGQLLAVGNAALDAGVESRVRAINRDAHLGSLIDAEREVREIGRMYGRGVEVLTGEKASEKTFKHDAGGFRILHIATHGILDDRAPMYSALALTASPDGDDGLLEAREILAMNIHADLAVLSACDTARGSIDSGEGVIGIAWAFLVAGCPSTVVSQWEAESKSTSMLMIELHRGLRAGLSKPEALRQAALALRRDRRYAHPFYWAPFIVVGAP